VALRLSDPLFTASEHPQYHYNTRRRVPQRFKSLQHKTTLRHFFIQSLPPSTRKTVLCLNVIVSPR
jgi:hypothetical protein